MHQPSILQQSVNTSDTEIKEKT